MLNNLDLFKIRLIGELAKSESVRKTAQTLQITSSAVSQNIKTLELILGRQLFLRVGKSFKPIPLASELVKLSQDFFQDLAGLLESSQEVVAEIKMGAPPIYGATGLLDQLEKIRSQFPAIQLRVTLLDTKRLVEDLLEGVLDFAIIDINPHLKELRELATQPFLTEELIMCCSKSFFKRHLKAGQSFKILKSLPHVPYHRDKEGCISGIRITSARPPIFQPHLVLTIPWGY